MRHQEIVNRLEELRGTSFLSDSDKSEIEVWYREILGKNFVKSSCNDCYQDAVIEMYLYLKSNGKMKEKCSYTLKNGVLLQTEFGGKDMYTNANLTDKVAEEYLAKHPKGIMFFAGMPNDWEERVAGRNSVKSSKKQEVNDTLLKAMIEALANGKSYSDLKEIFKEYAIDGTKISSKVLGTHIAAAKISFEAASKK